MAKQSGLHQLKGKVDGYSYYRQSGVNAGLMRRINEGMSARVKSSEEFANTRLNNSEFGNAADVAKVLASVIVPKFRPMFLNFSQAKLTKSLLSLIKQATGNWGQRALAATDVQAICDGVNLLAKNDFNEFCANFRSTAGEGQGDTSYNLAFDADVKNNLAAIGADGVRASVKCLTIYAGQYDSDIHAYVKSISKIEASQTEDYDASSMPTTLTDDTSVAPDSIEGTVALSITLAVLMPYREVNSTKYILQEKCTFKMIPTIIKTGA